MKESAMLPLRKKFILCLVLAVSACAPAVQIVRRPLAPAEGATAAMSASADERSLEASTSAARTISVLPFAMSSSDTTLQALGYGFADLLLTDLAVSHQLTLVERMHLNDVRDELALSASDQTDRTTALKIGRLVSARQIVLGSLGIPADSSLQFDADIATVSTGAVSSALAGHSKVSHLFDAKRQLALRLFMELGITLTADELHALDQIVAPNFKAFVAFSQGVRDEAKGDLTGAAANYTKAATIDPKFTLATQHAAQVEAKSSQATLRAANPSATANTGNAANTSANSASDAAATKADATASKGDAAKADATKTDATKSDATTGTRNDASATKPTPTTTTEPTANEPRLPATATAASKTTTPARNNTAATSGVARSATKAPATSAGVAASHSTESASKPTIGNSKPDSASGGEGKKTADSKKSPEKGAQAKAGDKAEKTEKPAKTGEKSDDASDDKKPSAPPKTKTKTKTPAKSPELPVTKRP